MDVIRYLMHASVTLATTFTVVYFRLHEQFNFDGNIVIVYGGLTILFPRIFQAGVQKKAGSILYIVLPIITCLGFFLMCNILTESPVSLGLKGLFVGIALTHVINSIFILARGK